MSVRAITVKRIGISIRESMLAESWMDELPAFTAPRGCPCTAQLLCQADERGLFDAECHIPLHGDRTYSMHGGAGTPLVLPGSVQSTQCMHITLSFSTSVLLACLQDFVRLAGPPDRIKPIAVSLQAWPYKNAPVSTNLYFRMRMFLPQTAWLSHVVVPL